MGKNILVLGTIAVDTVLNVDRLPRNDGFATVTHERTVAGGSSANVSMALKMLGNNAVQAGRISDDELGRIASDDLAANDIDNRAVLICHDSVTLHTYIVVDEKGNHFIIANGGGGHHTDIRTEELPEDILEGIDVFYTDMSWSHCSIFLAEKCRIKGIPVVFNLQNAPNERTLERIEYMNEMLDLCSLFITGQTTISETTGIDNPEDGFARFTNGKNFKDGGILTLGEKGAVWFGRDINIKYGIVDVPVVDTTGAGDAYIAGIMDAYYCREKTRTDSMAFAAELAACKCTQSGPRLRSVHIK